MRSRALPGFILSPSIFNPQLSECSMSCHPDGNGHIRVENRKGKSYAGIRSVMPVGTVIMMLVLMDNHRPAARASIVSIVPIFLVRAVVIIIMSVYYL
jgi:hypothetical protein